MVFGETALMMTLSWAVGLALGLGLFAAFRGMVLLPRGIPVPFWHAGPLIVSLSLPIVAQIFAVVTVLGRLAGSIPSRSSRGGDSDAERKGPRPDLPRRRERGAGGGRRVARRAAGEFVGILGPSGSGKSSLLYLLAGLKSPTSGDGEVRGPGVRGADAGPSGGIPARELRVHLPEPLPDQPPHEPREHPHRGEGDSAKLLEELQVGACRDKFPWQMSAGEKQRVAIAAAVVHRPRVVFATSPRRRSTARMPTSPWSACGGSPAAAPSSS
jgi:hypothetical protein